VKTKYSYWLFSDVISRKDRNKIKRLASECGYSDSEIQTDEYDNVVEPADSETRKSGIAFTDKPYIFELLSPYVHGANASAGWDFNIDLFEPVQIARYKKDEHYTWHRDGGSDIHHAYKHRTDANANGKVRKLSLVAKLSDNYIGGDLEFVLQGIRAEHEMLKVSMEVGDIIVFPSFVFHRSTPVTKGVKHSATMWCLGPPFK